MATWRAAGHRYYKYSHYLRERFGAKVQRVTVDGGFTCPNVDGTVAVGGCVFCDNRSFSPARRGPRIPIVSQIESGIAILDERYRPDVYLAYFQPASNTYAPLEKLKRLYDQAFENPKVVGIVVGTRPDCVPDPVLDLLESYTQRGYVAVEYGLESVHERSLDWMNRGHGANCYFDAVARSRGRGIDISTHVILGVPGESKADMLATIDAVVDSGVDGIKIHNLYVVKGTPLEEQYRQGRARVFERDEYLDLAIDVLERIPETMVIHRLIGDSPPGFLVAPQWTHHKAEFLQLVDRVLAERDTWQAKGLTSAR